MESDSTLVEQEVDVENKKAFWEGMCSFFISKDNDTVFLFYPHENDSYEDDLYFYFKHLTHYDNNLSQSDINEFLDVFGEYNGQELTKTHRNYAYQFFASRFHSLMKSDCCSSFFKRCLRNVDFETFDVVTLDQIKSLLIETAEKYRQFGEDMLLYIGDKIQDDNFKEQVRQSISSNVRNDNNSGCCLKKIFERIKKVICCNNDER